MLGVAAEKLDADRALGLDEFEILHGPLVAPEDPLGADEFRDHHVRALLLAELAENGVRDPGHRGEVKRELVLEPRKHESVRLS